MHGWLSWAREGGWARKTAESLGLLGLLRLERGWSETLREGAFNESTPALQPSIVLIVLQPSIVLIVLQW